MTLGDLYNVLTDNLYQCFFIVFEDNGGCIRYRLSDGVPNNFDAFLKFVLDGGMRSCLGSIDSGEIDILNASYIDCYYRYPIK